MDFKTSNPSVAEIQGSTLFLYIDNTGFEPRMLASIKTREENGRMLVYSTMFISGGPGVRRYKVKIPKVLRGRNLEGKILWLDRDGTTHPIKTPEREIEAS